MEIERKFLVGQVPELGATKSVEIEQGYLALGEDGEVRLRRLGDARRLTVKHGAGLVRGESEIEIAPEQFEALWPATEGRRLEKRRHLLPLGDVSIELDVYSGDLEGLVVAEVEFRSEDEARAFEPPGWLGEEVTGDRRYPNASLATDGAPGGPR